MARSQCHAKRQEERIWTVASMGGARTHHCVEDCQKDIEEDGVVHVDVQGQAQAARGRPEDLLEESRDAASRTMSCQCPCLPHLCLKVLADL